MKNQTIALMAIICFSLGCIKEQPEKRKTRVINVQQQIGSDAPPVITEEYFDADGNRISKNE